ncbi:hypothetical protein DLAC_11538 [Tieghemostelium lacteum]|uniref:Uncharacterized protein n=1 Tax=Tieghemostelium lacteum TaxID=361077 RepID=A0A152A240_TIELA|nr:hypothetical protein DLAC_11538 [Tieghemostelium lacteum]|eukprot:KYR00322.1 hypothetical protein DLAC_11538 [Tieghemostelium lacteum]
MSYPKVVSKEWNNIILPKIEKYKFIISNTPKSSVLTKINNTAGEFKINLVVNSKTELLIPYLFENHSNNLVNLKLDKTDNQISLLGLVNLKKLRFHFNNYSTNIQYISTVNSIQSQKFKKLSLKISQQYNEILDFEQLLFQSKIENLKIQFSKCTRIRNLPVISKFSHLIQLKVYLFNVEVSKDISQLIDGCRSLKYLDLTFVGITHVGGIFESISKSGSLEKVCLDSQFSIVHLNTIVQCLNRCLYLVEMKLKYFIITKPNSNERVMISNSKLEKLDLSISTVQDRRRISINQFWNTTSNMKILIGHKLLKPKFFNSLSLFTSLRTFKFTFPERFVSEDNGVSKLIKLNLTHLKKLSLNINCRLIPQVVVNSIFNDIIESLHYNTSLDTLKVYGNIDCNDLSNLISKNLKSIKTLIFLDIFNWNIKELSIAIQKNNYIEKLMICEALDFNHGVLMTMVRESISEYVTCLSDIIENNNSLNYLSIVPPRDSESLPQHILDHFNNVLKNNLTFFNFLNIPTIDRSILSILNKNFVKSNK